MQAGTLPSTGRVDPARLPRDPVVLGVILALALVPIVFDWQLYDDFTLAKQALMLLLCGALLLPGMAVQRHLLPADPLVRLAFGILTGWVLISWAAGRDPLGSIQGVYQYRQGLATWICYGFLFLGGINAGRSTPWRVLAAAGIAGLVACTIYTFIQATGADPISWWLDTRVRAIGTIGNANEMASYAVIAMAFGGAWGASRRGLLIQAALAAAGAFCTLEGESRTGVAALAVFIVLLPIAGWAGRRPWRESGLRVAAVFAGFALAVAVSGSIEGGTAAAGERLSTGVAGGAESGSTRWSLARGTLHSIVADPVFGAGPDGLYLEFPRHRPSGLEGIFTEYDLVVQSSHNWPLDLAANLGLPGLVATVALIVICMVRSLRFERRQRSAETPVIWAALAAYGAVTMVNPLSLAAHVTFWVSLGWLAGRADGPPEPAARGSVPVVPRNRWRIAAAAPASLALLALAVLLPIADRRADTAWGAYASHDFRNAAIRYKRAGQILPMTRDYRSREARSWLAAGIDGGTEPLTIAERELRRFDQQFGLGFDEAIALASARIGLHRDIPAIDEAIDTAQEVNPHGDFARPYGDRLRYAARVGGTLHYDDQRRWVLVAAALPEPELPPKKPR